MYTLFIKTIALILFQVMVVSGFSQYKNAIRIKITGNGYSDETIIRLLNGATEDFDGMYDAWKLFSSNPSVPSIYTRIPTGEELAINSLPEFSNDISIPIYTLLPVNGNYTVQIQEVYPMDSTYKLSFTHLSTDQHTPIFGDTSLVFNLTAQQNVPSFMLNISTPLLVETTNESCFTMNDGAISVTNEGNLDWQMEVYDLNNNKLAGIVSTVEVNVVSNIAPGVYKVIVNSKGIIEEYDFTIEAAATLMAEFMTYEDTIYLDEGGDIAFVNQSQNAESYLWDFGDGDTSTEIDPVHQYTNEGIYEVSLTVTLQNCSHSFTKELSVLLTQDNMDTTIVTFVEGINHQNKDLIIYATGNGNYLLKSAQEPIREILVYDMNGRLVYQVANLYGHQYPLPLFSQPKGIYLVMVSNENGNVLKQKIIR